MGGEVHCVGDYSAEEADLQVAMFGEIGARGLKGAIQI